MAGAARIIRGSALGLVLGAALGAGLALGLLTAPKLALPFAEDAEPALWQVRLETPSKYADPLARARAARSALMAPPAARLLRFQATGPEPGMIFDPACDYVLVGPPLDARWWSLAVYDDQGRRIENAARRWSYTMDTVRYDADGRYRIQLSRTERPGNWLKTGGSGFSLVLRLYDPPQGLLDDPHSLDLPRIVAAAGCAS